MLGISIYDYFLFLNVLILELLLSFGEEIGLINLLWVNWVLGLLFGFFFVFFNVFIFVNFFVVILNDLYVEVKYNMDK